MKTTLIRAIRCFNAILELENEKMDFPTAHALIIAKRSLEPHAQFYSDSERTLIEKYAISSADGSKVSLSGKFRLHSDHVEEYAAERAALNGVEIEIPLTPRKLKTVPNLRPSTLEALMDAGLFEFEDE